MQSVILAIDEGTTNAKSVLIDQSGQIIASAAVPLSLSHPQVSWSEQNPNEILHAVQQTINQLVTEHPSVSIAGIGISNQRESVLVWDRVTGEALTPVAIWQCRRSEAFCRTLADSVDADTVRSKTGLPIDPLFPAAKINCLLAGLDSGFERAERGELCVGTIDTWLAWNLSSGDSFVTDASNASRTQLFNIHTQQWDDELLTIFGVPRACLPEVLPSSAARGVTKEFPGLANGIPLLSQIGDSHAALYGQGGFQPGVIKATYGTGSSLMTPIQGITSNDYRLAQTVAWNDGELNLALEGNITHTGAGVDYISKLLNLEGPQQLADLANSVDSNNGVYFVPALSGLGAPHWQSAARGLVTGLTDAATSAHLCRAALESVAYQIADVFYLMEDMSGQTLSALLVDGGPTKNRWLMQFQADLLQKPVLRSLNSEVSALGAGYLAGKALGWWPNRESLSALPRQIEVIEPNAANKSIQQWYHAWKQAVKRTLYTP